VHLLGRLGDAQIGPIYPGWSAWHRCHVHRIEIIGLNMLASVNWARPVRAPAALAGFGAAARARPHIPP
jgi:hypothetical protein